jgi:hypothetical protein
MVFFKTQICLKRKNEGYCDFHNCLFAHGNNELRFFHPNDGYSNKHKPMFNASKSFYNNQDQHVLIKEKYDDHATRSEDHCIDIIMM